MKRGLVTLALVASLVAACGATPTATPAPVTPTPIPAAVAPTAVPTSTRIATQTPQPTATTAPTPSPTNTAKPTPLPATVTLTATAVPVALSAEAITQITGTYAALVYVQVDAQLLHDVALKVKDGSLEGFQAIGSLYGVAALVGGLDKALADFTPAALFRPVWDKALAVHRRTLDTLKAWLDQKMTSEQVLAEMKPVLADAASVGKDADAILAQTLKVDTSELTKQREDTLRDLKDALTAPRTPTVTP